jgi:hypothetical protein
MIQQNVLDIGQSHWNPFHWGRREVELDRGISAGLGLFSLQMMSNKPSNL